jgi:pseudaminic acid cytidylyltransferase
VGASASGVEGITVNLCIIPARAGSKRIPNKNRRPFAGKIPIIEFPVCEALHAKAIDRLVISTDDRELLKTYHRFALKRADKTSGDDAPLVDVVTEVLDNLDEPCDNVCVLLPCAVFVDSEDIDASFKLLDGKDAVCAVIKYNHPIERAMRLDDYMVSMIQEKYAFTRTQDLQPAYHDAGQFYWLNVKSFQEQRKIFMRRTAGCVLDFAVDIDDESDWTRAEESYRARKILAQ